MVIHIGLSQNQNLFPVTEWPSEPSLIHCLTYLGSFLGPACNGVVLSSRCVAAPEAWVFLNSNKRQYSRKRVVLKIRSWRPHWRDLGLFPNGSVCVCFQTEVNTLAYFTFCFPICMSLVSFSRFTKLPGSSSTVRNRRGKRRHPSFFLMTEKNGFMFHHKIWW